MKTLTSALALSFVLASAPCFAQDGPTTKPGGDATAPKKKKEVDPKAQARGQKVVDGLTFDAKLCKTYRFGIYMGGSMHMGEMTLTVKKAAEGSGAAYTSDAKGTLKLGKMQLETSEVGTLDARLGVVTLVSAQKETGEAKGMGGGENWTVKKDGDSWVRSFEGEGDAKRPSAKVKDGGLVHDGLASLVLLAQKVATQPGTYAFRKITWEPFLLGDMNGLEEGPVDPNNPSMPDMSDMEPRYTSVTLTVSKAKKVKHRGKEVEAYEVKVDQPETMSGGMLGGDSVVVISTKGEVLAIRSDEVSLVAGTAEEIKKDLPAEAESADAKAIRGVVMIVFKVLFKQLDADKLDAVVDWAALRDSMASDPEVAKLDVAAFTTEMKSKLHGKEEIPDEIGAEQFLPMMAKMLKIEIKKDTALVRFGPAGRQKADEGFKLKKIGDSWQLVGLPSGL